MLNSNLDVLPENAFPRLAELIAGITPAQSPILLSLGEPGHPMPDFVGDILQAHQSDYTKYPPIDGTPGFRSAAAGWLNRRFGLHACPVNPDGGVLPLNGTREGLFSIAFIVTPPRKADKQPAILMPNPFYQCYAGAAAAAGAEAIYLDAPAETGFLPDLDKLTPELLERTALFYLCSPANPQGAVAGLDYLKRLIALARKFDFVIAFDECYSEIYLDTPPPGGLQAAQMLAGERDGAGHPFANLLVFNSLSKRSNLAGLRSGLIAGDPMLLAKFRQFRAYVGPTNPLPADAVATAAWSDEAHVIANRALYREKFTVAEGILTGHFDYYTPAGGFFLWLNVDDSEAATKKLWREAGVKVLPGKYLSRTQPDGTNPGAQYIRVALVLERDSIAEGLRRIRDVLNG
ncbi:MAG TPA: aspartate aminotransferase [Alphaproteobacteria bacterium]|nr:aspartate aminotransferase [Alphaproteobacteria bacterium]